MKTYYLEPEEYEYDGDWILIGYRIFDNGNEQEIWKHKLMHNVNNISFYHEWDNEIDIINAFEKTIIDGYYPIIDLNNTNYEYNDIVNRRWNYKKLSGFVMYLLIFFVIYHSINLIKNDYYV